MLLALDTSTRTASVALLMEGGAVLERTAEVTTHSEMLLGVIDELVREAGVRKDAITAVGCGAGPGSYTGLRIGISTAKGVCFALGRPLLMVSSLAAVAAVGAPAGLVAVVLDAGKGQAYFGLFRDGAAVGVEVALPPAGLAAELATRTQEAVSVAGDGVSVFPEAAALGAVLHRGRPHAREVAGLAAARLARGESDSLATAEPRYAAEWQPTAGWRGAR